MGIQEDAGELLVYVYREYQKGEMVNSQNFEESSGWDKIRTRNAMTYLRDKELVKGNFYLGGNWLIQRPNPEGVDVIENQSKFVQKFGFELNLGLFKFSWETIE